MALQAAGLGVYNPAQHAVNGFVPTQLPGLQLWLDAGKTAQITNNATISTLRDFSANLRNFTNSSSSKSPTYKTAVFNGRNTLLFDGVDDNLHFEGSITYTQQSVYAVYMPSRSSPVFPNGFERLYSQRSSANHDYQTINGYIPILRDGNASNQTVWGSYAASVMRSAISLQSNAPLVFSSIHSGSALVNYSSGKTGTNASVTLTNAFTAHSLGSSCFTTGFDQDNFAGHVSELIVFGTHHSVEQRLQVERYLGTKYGIVVQ